MTNTASPLAAKIERAVDALLRALIDRPPPEQRADHVVTTSEDDEVDLDEADLDAVIADPVGSACRSEIAALGSFLLETLGSIEELEAASERIAGLDGTNKARRTAILDECWEDAGIDDEDDNAD